MRIGSGSSHAKIILIGEHSVVYGFPAIALPLPAVKEQAKLQEQKKGFGQVLHSRYYDGPLDKTLSELTGIQQLIIALLRYFDHEQLDFEMTITSDLPAERGMGSSAATAVAVIRAFYDFFQRPLPQETLLKWAAFSEKIIHGNPSGIDAATVSATHPIWFVKGQVPTGLKIDLNGYLLIADSGIKGRTGQAVGLVAHHMDEQPAIYQPKLADLGELTEAVKSDLATGAVACLGKHLTQAQMDLKFLGVSSKMIDRLVQVAQANQALGTKLTGGGQGGCIIALAKTKSDVTHLQSVMSQAGATQTWVQPLKQLTAVHSN